MILRLWRQDPLKKPPKFSYPGLLISLAILLVIAPILHEYSRGMLLEFGFSIFLLWTLHILSNSSKVLWIGIILVTPSLLLGWLSFFFPSTYLILLSHLFGSSFILLTIFILGAHVLRAKKIDTNLVFGGLSIYCFIGIYFALVYSMIELIIPNSFENIPKLLEMQTQFDRVHEKLEIFFYYSFVVLTTLGFGDIVPLSAPARTFSFLEAVIGQFYIATVVASLIGMLLRQRIVTEQTEKKNNK